MPWVRALVCAAACTACMVAAGACGGADFSGLNAPADDGGGSSDGVSGDDSTIGDASHSDGGAKDGGGGGDGAKNEGGAIDGGPGDGSSDSPPPPVCPSGSSCVDPVPSGWIGPFVFYSGSSAAPPCPGAYSVDAYDGNENLVAPPAQCSCSCGSASGVQCSTPSFDFFASSNCSGTPCASVALPHGQCTTVDPGFGCLFNLQTYDVTASAASGGSCTPQGSGGAQSPSWGATDRACSMPNAPTTAGCQNGQICVPDPTSPWASTVCVSQQGDVPCPSAAYTQRTVVYASYSDTRGCSPCTCGGVSGANCSGTITFYQSQNGSCTSVVKTAPLPVACTGTGGNFARLDVKTDYGPKGGSCQAQGGQPTGSADPTQPTTFCCAQ